jgi:hypothetical protein
MVAFDLTHFNSGFSDVCFEKSIKKLTAVFSINLNIKKHVVEGNEAIFDTRDIILQSTINRNIFFEGDEFSRQICRCDRATGRRS